MDIKDALKGQYHGTLAMLRQTIADCPDAVWESGKHPRTFWRIAYHALFYTHLYLMVNEAAFVPWEKHRGNIKVLWDDEKGQLPPIEPSYTQTELVEYLDFIDQHVNEWVDLIDLSSPDPGFSWYKIPKLEHQILNIRHLAGHMGQLSELLMNNGIDEVHWVSTGK